MGLSRVREGIIVVLGVFALYEYIDAYHSNYSNSYFSDLPFLLALVFSFLSQLLLLVVSLNQTLLFRLSLLSCVHCISLRSCSLFTSTKLVDQKLCDLLVELCSTNAWVKIWLEQPGCSTLI